MPKEKVKVSKSPLLGDGKYTVAKVNELNFFDIFGEAAKTKGTSAKYFHLELEIEINGNRAQIYTEYGPTGKAMFKEWRNFESKQDAESEYDKILRSKRKKGYKDVDVAQRAVGSEESKKITKAVVFTNAEHLKKPSSPNKLNEGQRRIVEIFYGSQAQFVAQTLKCPLGQLSNEQIDLGRDCLNAAKTIVNSSKPDKKVLIDLTNKFYGLIPHNNLGAGYRGKMEHLLLDDLTKIMNKEADLDTFLDAKVVGAVLKVDDSLDSKYQTLNCNFDEVPRDSEIFKFVYGYFNDTKVRNHGYGSVQVKTLWKMERKDSKELNFFKNAERISKECGRHLLEAETNNLSNGRSRLWTPNHRPDITAEECDLYNKANIWLCWHGTRSANLVGITCRGLLIRPAGAAYTGSYFGDGKYFAWQSSKSCGYCDGGYWTGGRVNNSKYMFAIDVALGNMSIQRVGKFFSRAPAGFHSVYGKAGQSLMNDEMITYDNSDKDNQQRFRYLLEIA